MTMILFLANTRTAKPWKNGGGITTDVLIWPKGTGMEDFILRVSIAEVASDGPFSRFDGIDRSTAILAGEGFDLTFAEGASHRLTRFTPPLAYPGDAPAEAALIAGTTTDLNAMTRRASAKHVMRPIVLVPDEPVVATGLTLLLVTGPVSLRAAGMTHHLEALDAVLMDGAEPVAVASETPATAYRIDVAINPA